MSGWRATVRFIASAYGAGVAYIDVDGTLLRKCVLSDSNLEHWMDNLMPMPVIWRRLAVCYLLKWLGVRLVLWTNRPPEFRWGTMLSLGRHVYLFNSAQFHGSGKGPDGVIPKPYKSKYDCMPEDGPVMDDGDFEKCNYLYPGSLHVRAL